MSLGVTPGPHQVAESDRSACNAVDCRMRFALCCTAEAKASWPTGSRRNHRLNLPRPAVRCPSQCLYMSVWVTARLWHCSPRWAKAKLRLDQWWWQRMFLHRSRPCPNLGASPAAVTPRSPKVSRTGAVIGTGCRKHEARGKKESKTHPERKKLRGGA